MQKNGNPNNNDSKTSFGYHDGEVETVISVDELTIHGCRYQSYYKNLLQIPKSKKKDSCTFSKIEPKIQKISQLQSVVEIALFDGF